MSISIHLHDIPLSDGGSDGGTDDGTSKKDRGVEPGGCA